MDKKKPLSEAAVIKDVPRITNFYKKSKLMNVEDIAPEDPGASTSSGAVDEAVPEQPEDCEPVPHLSTSTSTTVTGAGEPPEDRALWGALTESLRGDIIAKGASAFHNRAKKYPVSCRREPGTGKTRSLTNDLLSTTLQNGEIIKRDWIIYSPSTGEIYCFACKMFSSHNSFVSGFCDWKHSGDRVREHERGAEHRRCMLVLMRHTEKEGTVDASLAKQMEAEGQYWKQVLRRIVAVIKFLGERGLPFRGDDEFLQSPHNGNYLGILELITQFDPFLKEHIETYGAKGHGTTFYLSSTICEEFIGLMGDKTKQTIATELQQAKYFSIIVDSTPDMSHVDQLTFVFRFVSEKGRVVERFITFEPIHSHTGSSLAECVQKMVSDLGLDLSDCRGQAYDNASNMSRKYNGLQAHLKRQNLLIHYVPCAAHSLNLVGVNCVENSCQEASQFFDLLQALYAFCSSSTHRWNKIFNEDVTKKLKPLSSTRWSCRADTTRALCENYPVIRQALQMMASDSQERQDTRHEAAALSNKLGKLETALMIVIWNTVLHRFKLTSDSLQNIDLKTAVRLASLRGQFTNFETRARAVTGVTQTYHSETHRVSKRKAHHDETVENEVVLSGSKKFEVETYNTIIDSLLSGLTKQLEAYAELNSRFSVLFDIECDETELRTWASVLSQSYPADLDETDFADELLQFRSYVSTDLETCTSPANLLQVVLKSGLQTTFPNVYVALRLFLTIPVSNSLSLMAIESDLVKELDFEDLVADFAKAKSRKKIF
uniref:DUF4371 domain-containing protein n=1 Tax=Seriola dumerili TaxID=41447 RepID=A0A3B4ULL1_SERDU